LQSDRSEKYKKISEFIIEAQALSDEAARSLLDNRFPVGHPDRSRAERLLERARRIRQEENPSTASDDDELKVEGVEILRPLGSGGNGIVFAALQNNPRRVIAIKFLKGQSLDLPRLDRFNREIELISRLDHPDIIKLFSAGILQSGRGYFCMEYVEGKDILKHCAGQNLSLQKRLEIFVRACHAVDHGHRRLILHRDLKPSNVLVTAEGQLKLIDFGIGRLRYPDPDDEEVARYLRRQPFDEIYSSPELINNEAVDVETDIYSLGVILYRLLTDQLPAIRDHRKPSELSSVEQAVKLGLTDSATMRKKYAGDLDLIVMKALDPVPGRRYKHPNDLAQDLMNFVSRWPIQAREQTFAYRLRLFLSRNSRWVAFTCTLFLTVLAVALVATWEWTAEREATKAAHAKAKEAERSLEKSILEKKHAVSVQEFSRDALQRLAAQLTQDSFQQRQALSKLYWQLAQEYTADRKLNFTLVSRALENTDKGDPIYQQLKDKYDKLVVAGDFPERGTELAAGPTSIPTLIARLQIARIQLETDGTISEFKSLKNLLSNSLGSVQSDSTRLNALLPYVCGNDGVSTALNKSLPRLGTICGSGTNRPKKQSQ
jgi:Protein kinase domain